MNTGNAIILGLAVTIVIVVVYNNLQKDPTKRILTLKEGI